jgi:ankyrin repeat protein
VAFQIEELCSRHCDDEIRKAIRDLPKDLTETFNRALRRIVSSQHADIAQRCFRWVAAAQRPLTRDELREAISIEIGQLHSIEERLTNGIHLISSWCENLLVCDEEKYIVQFAHHSVQEFLTTEQSCHDPHAELDIFHFKLQDAGHFIGEICVSYLNFDDLKTSLARPPQPQRPHHSKRSHPRVLPSDIAWNTLGNVWPSKVHMHALRRFMSGSEVKHSVLDVVGNLANFNEDLTPPTGTSQPEHPFLEYASMHWLQHTKEFQKDVSKTWNLWQKMVRYGHNLAQFPWAPTSLEHHFQHRQSTDYASDNNIEDLLYSQPEEEEYHPLKWAFNNRHRAILWLIFHADPSLPINMFYRLTSALIARSIWEQDVQLLDIILSGSNKLLHLLDLPIYASNNALQAAASAGHLEVTERLLAAGVNVDATTPRNGGKTALRLAAEAGHLAVTARLIEAGADLNLHLGSGYDGLTALHVAAREGHFGIVEILLTAGANPHALTSGDERLTALHLAAESGHLEIITRLLTAGLDVNNNVRPWGRGLTPLHVATKAGHLKVVELLLDMGATVKIYLPQQANTNVHLPLHGNKNAMHLAAEADHFEIVRLFLEKGSDPNGYISPLDEGLTPMHLAARRGHSGIVQLLLAGGARVDSRLSPADGNHTALYIAAEEGHVSTMLVLLAAGADVDAPSTVNGYRTALFTAAIYGKSAEVVRFLIDAGANVNATVGSDEGGWTILDLCSEQGEIYDMLLAAGAVANIDARAAAVWRQDNITSNEQW